MKWVIAPNSRVEIHAFAGLNHSGNRDAASVHPVGGRQGQDIDGSRIRSVAVAGLPGTRVVFCTSVSDTDWMDRPWRAVVVGPDWGFKARGGLCGVRIPNLDCQDDPTAKRWDPDFEVSYDIADSLDAGEGWTYGNPGTLQRKIVCIRIDRIAL